MLALAALAVALLFAAAEQVIPPPITYRLVEHPIHQPEELPSETALEETAPDDEELALAPDPEEAELDPAEESPAEEPVETPAAPALPPPIIRTYDFADWRGRTSPAWSSARPLRHLSIAADDALRTACNATEAGAAVLDLRTGRRWLGGSSVPRTIRSVAKAPLALAAILQAEREGASDDPELAEQTAGAVSRGSNDAATALYDRIGGSAGQAELYRRLGLPRLADQVHPWAWGLSTANAADLADLLAAFAASPEISEQARRQLLDLMLRTNTDLHWGAIAVPDDWQLAVRTGLFYEEPDNGLHLNSAALWLDPAGAPAYAIAIISQDDHFERRASWNCQYHVGQSISAALADRARRAGPQTTLR